MKKTDSKLPKNIDEYLAPLPVDVRNALEKIRQIVMQLAPDAVEVISYGMPAFKYHGMLLYFGAFTNHCSLFAGSKSVIEDFKDELKNYKTAPGTIQFTVDKQLPAALVKKIVKARMKQNEQKKGVRDKE